MIEPSFPSHGCAASSPGPAAQDPAVPSPAAGAPSATPPAAGDYPFAGPDGQPQKKPADLAAGGGAVSPAGEQPLFTLPPLRSSDLCEAAAASRPDGGFSPFVSRPGAPWGGSVLADVVNLRADQVERHGHTPAADDALDLYAFAQNALRIMSAMKERASLHQLEGTRTYAVKAAAFCLALAESCDRRLASLDQDYPA